MPNFKDEIAKKIYDDLQVWYLKDKNMSRLNALNVAGVILQVSKELGQEEKGTDLVKRTLEIAKEVFEWGFQDYRGSGVEKIADKNYDPVTPSPQGEIPF